MQNESISTIVDGFKSPPPESNDRYAQSFGEKAVGLSFNPSNSREVDRLKVGFAQLIDQMNNLRNETTSGEVKRLCSVAITEAQGAQMWAVKAATWRD